MRRQRKATCLLLIVGTASAVAGAAWLADGKSGQISRTSPSTGIKNGRFPVRFRQPAGGPRVELAISTADGRAVTAACGTCHATRPPDIANRRGEDLDEFHQGLVFAHGKLTCLSCHNRADYDSLKLADGSPVAFSEVMTLCAQCHGPQMRDYLHGSHGGMTGHWDLSRGPRTRNNCVDCHDPHAPQFPQMQPTFKPRDRFLGPHHAAGH